MPRGRRCSPGLVPRFSRRLPLPNGQSLNPAHTTHQQGRDDEVSTEVHAIHPSGLPLACDSQVERELLGFPPSFGPRRYQRRPSGWGQALEHQPRTTFVDISRPSHPRVHSQCATSCRTGSSHRPGNGTASEDTAGKGMFTRAGVSQAPPVEHPARLADSQGAPLIANCCRSVAVDLRRHRTGVASSDNPHVQTSPHRPHIEHEE